MTSQRPGQYYLHHLLFWSLVFGAWYFLRYQDYSRPAIALKVTAIKVLDLAAMVYITNYLLLPKLLYRKRWLLFILAFLLLIVSSSLLKMNIIGRVMNNPSLFSLDTNLKARIYDNIIPHFFLVLAGAAIKLMFDYRRLQQRMAETAKEKAEAELNFLKSQINPHFLFNSLNSVYFMIEKENEAARNALQKFSDMLRFQLYETDGKPVPLVKELAYLEDYIDLQRLRKDEQFDIRFSHEGDFTRGVIEPLLLIPFVENAFKHVSSLPLKRQFVYVELKCRDDELFFRTSNSCGNNSLADSGKGIGLKNVKRRLELLYPGRHTLDIAHEQGSYTATLIIKTEPDVSTR